MDSSDLFGLGTQLLQLIAPQIARGAPGADAMSGPAGRAWALLHARLAADPKAAAALTLYEDEPNDQGMQQRVARRLAASIEGDAAAIAELRALVQQLQAQTKASAGPGRTHTLNIAGNAQVGSAIAGDVHGGLTVGPIDFSKRTIVGATAKPAAAPPAPTARLRPPETLSADGVHFSYGHALLIGVGEYERSGLSAPTTANDARALAELLRDPQSAAYPREQVHTLAGGAATRTGILDALDDFAAQLDTQATALIFFAGHGVRHADGYFLLPHDYDPADLGGSAISAQEFHERIAAIRERARRLIVLLNCCYAGGVGDHVLGDSGAEAATAAPSPDFYQPLAVGSGQIVISSSRPLQASGAYSRLAPDHTVFGAQLLAALRGAAPGDAAGIGVFELFGYLSAHVPADAQQTSAALRQNPLLYAHQLDQNVAVALRPGWQGGTLSAELDASIRELAELEVALAGYADEAQAPAALLAQRDALLTRLGA